MPQDSTVTVQFIVPSVDETAGETDYTIARIIIVERDYGKNMLKDFVLPVGMVVLFAVTLFLLLIKIKPSSRTDKLLTKIENRIPKILRF
jgi:hypothetical protein